MVSLPVVTTVLHSGIVVVAVVVVVVAVVVVVVVVPGVVDHIVVSLHLLAHPLKQQ